MADWTLQLKEAPEQHTGVISLLRDEWDNHGLLARTSLARQALLTEAVVAAKVTTGLTSSASRSTRAEGDR
jgi:hypothetical protein